MKKNKNKPEAKKILFICGSLNQTTMMHEISKHLCKNHDCFFTPYYADGLLDMLMKSGLMEWNILGGEFRTKTMNYLHEHNLKVDYYGLSYDYDLVFTGSDLIVPKNIRNKRLILVQEGMTNPRNLGFYLVKYLKLPGYIGDTAATGLSDAYDYFCVASEGYRDFFTGNGVNPDKIKVTGIPNYDNCRKYYDNDFPYKNFVLAGTSDARETMIYENRKKFIEKVTEIADGRQIIYKLHPNEVKQRAVSEIEKWSPKGTLVYTDGNIHEMIANCDVLITKFSTTVYTGIALGKEVYSDFDLDQLRELSPIQNGGTSAKNIAEEAEDLLSQNHVEKKKTFKTRRIRTGNKLKIALTPQKIQSFGRKKKNFKSQ